MSTEIEHMVTGLVKMCVPANEINEAKNKSLVQGDTLPLETVIRKYFRLVKFQTSCHGCH